jgi:hypothetical protein
MTADAFAFIARPLIGLTSPQSVANPNYYRAVQTALLKAAMNHTIIGEYKRASKDRPGGRLDSGGHTDAAMDEMKRRGIALNVTRTATNGVRFGNVPDHKESFKRSGEKQTWFPSSWTEHEIKSAGIYVANKGSAIDNIRREATHRDIAVRVMLDGNGGVVSIFPSYDQ